MKHFILSILFIFAQQAFSLENLQKLEIIINKPYQKFVTMQRYERKNSNQSWQAVGLPIKAILGKRGTTDQKQEGDLKTPLGDYLISQAFGTVPNKPIAMSYYQLTNATRCIDDSQSRHYNRIIETTSEKGEKMKRYRQYKQGFVVDYNQDAVAKKGSCIFIHLIHYKKSKHGTSGCIAINATAMNLLWQWLDQKKNPHLYLHQKER